MHLGEGVHPSSHEAQHNFHITPDARLEMAPHMATSSSKSSEQIPGARGGGRGLSGLY